MNVRLLLAAGQHFAQATVETEGKRILDVLNDKNSDYLKLANHSLSWGHDPDRSLGAWPRGALIKSNLILALPFGTEHEAPQRRHNLMVRKSRYEVALTLPDYDVRGFVHLVSPIAPLEYQAQLQRDGANFFAITGATLTHRALPHDPLEAPVALISRSHIGFFEIAEHPVPDPTMATMLARPAPPT